MTDIKCIMVNTAMLSLLSFSFLTPTLGGEIDIYIPHANKRRQSTN